MAARRRRRRRARSGPSAPASPATPHRDESTPSPPHPTTTPAQKLALLAGGTLLGLLLLGAAEGLLALLGVGAADGSGDLGGFAPGRGLFEVREQAGEKWLVTRPSRLLWFNEQRFPRRKAPGTLRIFTLGGSTTFGRPYDDAVSFSSWLRLLLDEAEPARRHEVINAGGISYASFRIDVLLGEILAYEPDVLVVYTGHNEFLEERTWPELSQGPGLLHWVQGRLSRLRTVTLLRQAFGDEDEGRGPLAERGLDVDVRARLDVQDGLEAYRRDDALRDRIVAEFRENLDRIVRRAHAQDVPVVLVKPASNLKDFSPFKSEPSAEEGGAEHRRFEALIAEGRARLGVAEPQEALTPLREAARLDPRHAEARFLLGRAELALDRPEAARPELETAREEDVCPLRALESITTAVAEVGAQAGVPVIDLPALLEQESRERGEHGLLGDEHFLDHVHPTVEVHQRLAGELLLALEGMGIVGGGQVPGERRDALFARHLDGLDAAYFARRDVNLGKVLGWAGKREEARRAFERAVAALPQDAEAHFYLGIQLQAAGDFAEAAARYRRAAELEPRHFRARFNLGRALQEQGDPHGALEAFQAARERNPGDAGTLYELARTYFVLDRTTEARAALEEARAADPELKGLDQLSAALTNRATERESSLAAARLRVRESPADPAGHNALGEALGSARQLDAAEGAFRRALEIDPTFAPARWNLAALYQLRGDLSEAEAALSTLVEQHPRDAQARLDLGILRRARGNVVGAAGAFRQAVALQPDLAQAWNNLGAALLALGDRPAALEAFRNAVRHAPDDADAHHNLAQMLREAGREDEARRHSELAWGLDQAKPARTKKGGGIAPAP